MSKRQNLIRLSITLFLILALAVGIVFATADFDFGAKGGETVLDGDSSIGINGGNSQAFVDMPDIAKENFVMVDDEALKPENCVAPSGEEINTAGELIYVLTKATSGKYKLMKDFAIISPSYLYLNRLHVANGVELDGNDKRIVTDYITGITPMAIEVDCFGGFLAYNDGLIYNLNYYLAPTATLVVAQEEDKGARWNVTLGGFIGKNSEKGRIENCNINIYGTLYTVRCKNNVNHQERARTGGVFGILKGRVWNCAMNVIGATVSASSHSTNDGFRVLGGIAAIVAGGPNFDNNVLNVAPSTIISADLLGVQSNIDSQDKNELGLYFGNLDPDNDMSSGEQGAQNFENNIYVNYNSLYDFASWAMLQPKNGPFDGNTQNKSVNNYGMPKTIGYTQGYVLTQSTHKTVNIKGGSFFGDDVKFVAGRRIADGNNESVRIHINKRSLTSAAGTASTSGLFGNDAGVQRPVSELSAETSYEFYEGISAASPSLLVKDSYSWNRLVSMSGTAYFDESIMANEKAAVTDPLKKLPQDIQNKIKAYRKNVILDTKGAGGEFAFDSKAAPAFELFCTITGNNGLDPAANVMNISEMTRSSGAIRKFSSGGISNVTIKSNKTVRDGGAVYRYVGGIIDYLDPSVKLTNCVIDNAFNYTKINSTMGSMVTGSNCNGNLYIGGVFGRMGGTLDKVHIINNSSIDITGLIRPDKTVYIGGLAAQTSALTIDNSIIENTVGSIVTIETGGNMVVGGLIGESYDASGAGKAKINIKNAQITNTIGTLGSQVASGKIGRFGGLLGGVYADFTATNTVFDMRISAEHAKAINYKKGYMFENVEANISMTNTYINANEMYNLGIADRAFLANAITGTTKFNNAWVYNLSRIDEFKAIGKGFEEYTGFNVISAIGNTKESTNAKKKIAPRGIYTNDVAYLQTIEYYNALNNPKFYLETSSAVYDGNKEMRSNQILSREVAKRGNPLEFTVNEIGAQEIGWFNGTTLGPNANFLDGRVLTNGAKAVIKATIEPHLLLDANNNQYVDYNDYALSFTYGNSDKRLQGARIVGFLSTKDVKNSVEWNQVAKNVNAGYSRSWLPTNIINDIEGDVITMGIADKKGVANTIAGKVPVFDINGDPVIENGKQVTRPANLTVRVAAAGGRRTGIFGHVSSTGVITDLNISSTIYKWAGTDANAVKTNTSSATNPPTNDELMGAVVAAYNAGKIEKVNVELNSTVDLEFSYGAGDVEVGILAGRNDGTINKVNINVPNRLNFRINNMYLPNPADKTTNTDTGVTTYNKPVYRNYIGGAIGLNGGSGTVSNVSVNLGGITMETNNTASNYVFISGAIGYNNNASDKAITALYVAAKGSNFGKVGKESGPSYSATIHNPNGTLEAFKGTILAYSDANTDFNSKVKLGAYFDKSEYKYIKQILLKSQGNFNTEKLNEINIKFDVDFASNKNDVKVTLVDDKTFATTGFTGYPRNKETGEINTSGGSSTKGSQLSDGDTTYGFSFTEAIRNVNYMNFEIKITLIDNTISNVEQWNSFATLVNEGAKFRGFTFKINQNISFVDSELNMVGINDNMFEGIIEGVNPFDGKIPTTITIGNTSFVSKVNAQNGGLTDSGFTKNRAMISKLGSDGVIRNLKILVSGNLNISTNGKDSASALVVAENLGTIEDLLVEFKNVSPSSNRVISAKNAGVITAKNYGLIDNLIVNINTNRQNMLDIKGNQHAGILAGINGALTQPKQAGEIKNINMVTNYVRVTASNNVNGAGQLVGEISKTARMSNIVNAIRLLFEKSSSSNTNEYTKYFAGKVENDPTYDAAKYIDNVWVLADIDPDYNNVSNDRFADTLENGALFNIMFKFDLNTNSSYSNTSIKADVNKLSGITFKTEENVEGVYPYYGYITDFKNAKDVAKGSNFNITKNAHGRIYAAVYANQYIDSYEALQNIASYSKEDSKINGLKFILTSDIAIPRKVVAEEEIDELSWEAIPYLNHIIDGDSKYKIGVKASTKNPIKSNVKFSGFFDTIGASGGLTNVNIDMPASVGANADEKSAVIAKTNLGRINNVDVQYYGQITTNTSNGLAGIMVADNMGSIENSSVTFDTDAAFNADLKPALIKTATGGFVAGRNSGYIIGTSVNVANDAILETSVFGGGLVGENTRSGKIVGDTVINKNLTLGENVIYNTVISLNSTIKGDKIGGIAGNNSGVINNIRVDLNGFTKAVEGVSKVAFGGVAHTNSGYIGYTYVDVNADSKGANINQIAGVAINSNGFIGSTVVNIDKPLTAVSDVAGLAFKTSASNGNAIINREGARDSEVVVPSAINDILININVGAGLVGGNTASGFVYENRVKSNYVTININADIVADKAAVLGNAVYDGAAATYIGYNMDNDEVFASSKAIDNSHFYIIGKNVPKITANSDAFETGVTGSYFINDGVKYDNSWFVKNNTYSLDLGTIGLNEYKAVSNNKIDVDIVKDRDEVTSSINESTITITISGNSIAFAREFNRDGKLDYKPGISIKAVDEFSGDGTKESTTITFAPKNSGSKDRVVTFSEFNLDITTEEQFDKLSDDMVNNDLFYNIPITIGSASSSDNLRINVTKALGTMYPFNANLIGLNSTIVVTGNLAAEKSGLFGVIGEAGEVHDIIVEVENNVTIGNATSKYSGALAGEILGKVENVAVYIKNSMNKDALANIIAGEMYGAFAGRIDANATIDNAWTFMQNGRFPVANAIADEAAAAGEVKVDVNVVNLGGVSDELEISFNGAKNAAANKNFVITLLDTSLITIKGSKLWQDISTDYVQDITPATLPGKTNAFIMPNNELNRIYSVSLINNNINDLNDLLELSANQRGFNINENEVFELLDDIVVDAASLDEVVVDQTAGTTIRAFYAIGTTALPFRSHFNGNGHSIIFTDGVTMTSEDGKFAGLFGKVERTAYINNVNVVYNTNSFMAENFAGGLAAVNKSENIENVVVNINTSEGPKNVEFGGIFAESTAPSLKGVYLIKHYQTDIKPVYNALDYGFANVINVYKDVNDAATFTLSNNNDGSYSIVTTAGLVPFYGLINVSPNTVQNKETVTLANANKNVNQEFAAVFVNNVLSTKEDLLDMNEMLITGYNIKWLEFRLDKDILLEGFVGNAISHDNSVPFEAIINGDGHTLTIKNSTFRGTNAGLLGTIGEYGIVKNLIVDLDKATFGSDGSGNTAVTKYAGAIAGRNMGTIENVVVKNLKGNSHVIGQYASPVVGDNAGNKGKLNNAWLVQLNNTQSAVVDDSVNVVELVGTTKTVNIKIDKGTNNVVITPDTQSGDKSFIYAMNDMTKPIVGNIVAGEDKGNKYIITDFDLIITDEATYTKFISKANSKEATSLKDVVITFKGDKDGKLVINGEVSPLGTKEKKFDGIIDGASTKLIFNIGSVVKGVENVGVFGYIGKEGIVRNLEIYMYGTIEAQGEDLTPLQTENKTYSDVNVGIVGYNEGAIDNTILLFEQNADIKVSNAGKVNMAGGVARTETTLNNTWYIKSTDTLLPATVTKNISGINVMTLVGKLALVGTDVISNKDGTVSVAFETRKANVDGKPTGNPVGVFYEDFQNAGQSATTYPKLDFKAAHDLVYEWVNIDYNIDDASDWNRLAVDTRAGYTFANKKAFTITKKNIEIEATYANSLGKFAGTIKPSKVDEAADIVLVNSASGNMVDFVLINELAGLLQNVNINVGSKATPLEFSSANVSKNPQGIVINNNNGEITGGSAKIYVNINNNAPIISAFVGTNNNSISNYSITVGGKQSVSNSYGHIAVINNKTLNNVTLTLDGAKVDANGNGHFALAVAKNMAGAITNLKVNVDGSSYIHAALDKANFVGGFVGLNNANIDSSSIEFVANPDNTLYLDNNKNRAAILSGNEAAFFVGQNKSIVDNVYAKAINKQLPTELEGKFNFVFAQKTDNNYDFNGGEKAENTWIIVDDIDTKYDKTVYTESANILKIIGISKDIKVNTDSVPYTFNAEVLEQGGHQFSGWFDNAKNNVSDIMDNSKLATNLVQAKFEAVFLATIITDANTWNEFATLVNSGKDVTNVVYTLANDITLEGNITPVGVLNAPFGGKIQGVVKSDGTNPTVFVNGKISAGAAGIFGYTDSAIIANINVTINDTATITGGQTAGALVGNAKNTIIAPGTFDGIEFTPAAINQVGLKNTMTVVNNGVITADRIAAGGAIGYAENSTINYVTVNNGGLITAPNGNVGGIIGSNKNSTPHSLSMTNHVSSGTLEQPIITAGTIEGNVAGGLIGLNDTSAELDKATVNSIGDAKILGTYLGGGLVGNNVKGVLNHSFIKFNLTKGTETKAVYGKNNSVISNTWVVTTKDVPTLDNLVGGSSLRVIRTDDVNNVGYAVNVVDTNGVVFANKLATGKFDYWRNTYSNDTLYANDNIVDANGIKKGPDASFDITLEQIDTITNVDQLRALALFATNTKNVETQHLKGVTINIANDIYINEAMNINMVGGYTINAGHNIITVSKDVHMYGGKLADAYVAIGGALTNDPQDNVVNLASAAKDGKELALSNVKFVDSRLYRDVAQVDTTLNIPDRDANDASQFIKYGSFDFTYGIAAQSTYEFVASRDIANKKVDSSDNTKAATIVIGNVPLVLSRNSILGYDQGVEYGVYTRDMTDDNVHYYFMPVIDQSNSESAYTELDYLLKNGFDFTGEEIVMSVDVTLHDSNVSLGTNDHPFNGTISGGGNTLTFGNSYNPMFAKIGTNGVIKDFVIKVSASANPVFQAYNGHDVTGTMSNIVIINDNDAIRYNESSITYDSVLVIQGYPTIENNAMGEVPPSDYTNIYELRVDNNLGVIKKVSEIVTVDNVGTDNVEFNVTMNKAPEGFMFGGFYNKLGSTDGTGLIAEFANGINKQGLVDANKTIYAYMISNIINNVDGWNIIANNVSKIATPNDVISLSANIDLTKGASAMASVNSAATINGNGHKLTLSNDFDSAVINGYNGTITNLVIDASALNNPMAAEQLILGNNKKFENVVVITKPVVTASAVALANESVAPEYITVIIKDGITFTNDGVDAKVITFTNGENTSFVHIMDANDKAFIDQTYGSLDLGQVTGKKYTVELVSAITNEEQIISLNKAGTKNVTLGGNVEITKNVTINNASATIDAKGKEMVVAKDMTLTLDGTAISNVVIKGLGAVDLKNSNVTCAVILNDSKRVTYEAGTLTRVWVNTVEESTIASTISVDLSSAYIPEIGKQLFDIVFAEGASNTFKLVMNSDGDIAYFLGASDDSGKIVAEATTTNEFVLKDTYTGVAKFNYISSHINNLAELNSVIDAVNTHEALVGKSFVLENSINAYTENIGVIENEINAATAKFTIDGQNNELVLNVLDGDVLANVTLLNTIVEVFGVKTDATPDNFLATIGDGVVVITRVAITIPDENVANYKVINVKNYDVAGNTFEYAKGIVNIVKERNFIAKSSVNDGEATKVEKIDLNAVTDKVTNIEFYIPVSIRAQGINNDELFSKVIAGAATDVVYRGDVAEEHKLMLNVVDNIIINATTVSGVKVEYFNDGTATPQTEDDNLYVKYKLNKEGIQINIVINIENIAPNRIVNKENIYSKTADYNTPIVSILPTVSLNEPGYTAFINAANDRILKGGNFEKLPEGTVIGDAGTYKRDIEVKDAKGNVVGRVVYEHVIKPYEFTGSDFMFIREYIANVDAAYLDTTTEFFLGLPAELQDAINPNKDTNKLFLRYQKSNVANGIKIVYDEKTNIDELNAISPNYRFNPEVRYKGNIIKKKITINFNTSDALTYEFNHLRRGSNVLDGIGYDAVKQMIAGDVIPLEVEIGKASGNSYFVINDDGMLDVGEYAIASNIADTDNYTFVVNVDPKFKVVIEPTTYAIGITNNDAFTASKRNFLSEVKPNMKYFNATVNGIDGIKVDVVYSNEMWDAISTVVGSKRIFTALPGSVNKIIANANSVNLTYAGMTIAPKNYTISNAVGGKITGDDITFANVNLGNGLTLASREAAFNGTTPKMTVKVNPGLYGDAGIYATAEFVDADVKHAGKYKVKVRVYSSVIGAEITKYVDIRDVTSDKKIMTTHKNESNETDYFESEFSITKIAASMKYVDNKSVYLDAPMSKDNFFAFNEYIDKMFKNGGLFDSAVSMKIVSVDAEGNESPVNYTNELGAGTYKVTIVLDGNIANDIDVSIIGATSATLTIDKKELTVNSITHKGATNMTYGDAFAGVDYTIYMDGAPFVGDIKFALKYSDGIEDGAVLNAGTYDLNGKITISTDDANYYVAAINTDTIKLDKVVVAPKEVTVTLSYSRPITREYGNVSRLEKELNKGIRVDGKTVSGVSGIFSYTTNVGDNDIVLVGINSTNYKMKNGGVKAKGKLVFEKLAYQAVVDAIKVDKVNNTTTIIISSETDGDLESLEEEEIVIDGSALTAEQITEAVNKYLAEVQGADGNIYDITIENEVAQDIVNDIPKVEEAKEKMTKNQLINLIVLAAAAVLLLIAIILFISAIVGMSKMPAGFNKDFNFNRDDNDSISTLMKSAKKRREGEYKQISGQLSKAAKKGKYYNVEDTLFPEAESKFDDNDDTESEATDSEDNE